MLPGFNQYCREFMCLAQGHNTVTPVGIEPLYFGVDFSLNVPVNNFKPPVNLLTIPRRYFCCGSVLIT